MRGLCALAVLAAACTAQPPTGELAGAITLAQGLAPRAVSSLDFYLLAGKTVAGNPFNCAALGGQSPATRADVRIRLHRLLPLADAHLGGIAAESQLTVAIDAYPTADATGARTGFGCQDGIAIQEDEATAVTVTVQPVP
jgi:hypothetical protein